MNIELNLNITCDHSLELKNGRVLLGIDENGCLLPTNHEKYVL